jgi:insertion element IS1 protein InsB
MLYGRDGRILAVIEPVEMSFVGKKSNQRWTWYAIDKASGIILAWHNGKRTDADFQQLLQYLGTIPIDFYYTDGW